MNILAFEMASPGNRHCANCIGALSFPTAVREVATPLRKLACHNHGITQCYLTPSGRGDIPKAGTR